MATFIARFRKSGLIALVGATSLVVNSAGPSAAQVPGEIVAENAGVGYEFAHDITSNCNPPGLPILGNTPGSEFVVTDTGTYDGVAPGLLGLPTTVASFVGSTEVRIRTKPYVISPEGTYSDCTLTNPLVEIEAASITTPVNQTPDVGAGRVNCPNLSGTYTRRAFDVIEITLVGQCDVQGNVIPGHVVDQSTTHVIVGLQQPCTFGLPTGQVPPEGCLLFPDAGSYVTWDHVVEPVPLPTTTTVP